MRRKPQLQQHCSTLQRTSTELDPPNSALLLVGLVDVLRQTPDEIIQRLNASGANSVGGFTMCSIPRCDYEG